MSANRDESGDGPYLKASLKSHCTPLDMNDNRSADVATRWPTIAGRNVGNLIALNNKIPELSLIGNLFRLIDTFRIAKSSQWGVASKLRPQNKASVTSK